MPSTYPVSILIPVHKTEEYIERCAISLFEQDFKEIEYIFIDDASPDHSLEILQEVLERYPQRKPHTRILTNPKNLGLYQTRKRGLYESKGEYILHADSDDWMEPDMVSSLYKKAKETNADITSCSYLVEYPTYTRCHGQFCFQDPKEHLRAVARLFINPNVWNKLIRKKLHHKVYQELSLSLHLNIGEDWLITFPAHYLTDKFAHIFKPLYHYNKTNINSLTLEKWSDKHYQDQLFVKQILYAFLKDKMGEPYLQLFKSHNVLPCLWKLFLNRQKLDPAIFQSFGITFLSLLKEKRPPLAHRLVYSFYLLDIPVIPELLRSLRNLYRNRLVTEIKSYQ